MATIFETEICTRCNGSGHHQSHILHGTICFKCNGNKETFSKRGLAAKKYFDQCLKVKVSDLKVGDLIFCKGWKEITSITYKDKNKGFSNGEWHESHSVHIGLKNDDCPIYSNERYTQTRYPVDALGNPSKEEFQKLKDHCLDYQSKLGKHGRLLKQFDKEVA